jgi:hypothetical protein
MMFQIYLLLVVDDVKTESTGVGTGVVSFVVVVSHVEARVLCVCMSVSPSSGTFLGNQKEDTPTGSPSF